MSTSLHKLMMKDDDQRLLLLQPFLSSSSPSSSTAAAAAALHTRAATVEIPSTPNHIPPLPKIIIPLSSSSFGIILRVAFIISIGIVSIWANHEASKGFSVSIVNQLGRDKTAGRRFELFYVSNDEASRLLLSTSNFVENFLYPSKSYPKKQVSHVTLQLSSRNISQAVIVDSGEFPDQFVFHISPSIFEETNFKHTMFVEIQRGMVCLWLWDGLGNGNNAPLNLVHGIVEYVSALAISGGGVRLPDSGSSDSEISWELEPGQRQNCWMSTNAKEVARFLNYCEMKKPGLVRRLNRGMRNGGWHDGMLDDALLGLNVQHMCDAAHHNSSRQYQSII